MKIRTLSTLVVVTSITGVAVAQKGYNTRIVASVRDDSGRPVNHASVRLFGPFGFASRRSADVSTTTGRDGVAEQSALEGRYLVYAEGEGRGSAIATFDANDRSGINRVDLKLKPTRQPVIQFVLMSDDRNEPVGGADIVVTSGETGRRTTIRSNNNGITPYDVIGSERGSRFDVSIMSRDFDTVVKTVNFRPRSQTDNTLYFVSMRRKTGSSRPDGGFDRRGSYKLDGMIRPSNKDRQEVGGLTSIEVGLLYSDGRDNVTRGHSTVTITRPDGSTILDQSTNLDLSLNEYATRRYEIRPNMPGTYTVNVRAEGERNSRWNGKYTFQVFGRGRGENDRGGSNLEITTGDYLGLADMEMDNRSINSHQISITLDNGRRNYDNVKGWLSPRRGEGFHITFKGSYDYSSGRLDAVGTMNDRTDKRWDIRLTGSPDRNGKIAARLVVRALDNSYNRSFNITLGKR